MFTTPKNPFLTAMFSPYCATWGCLPYFHVIQTVIQVQIYHVFLIFLWCPVCRTCHNSILHCGECSVPFTGALCPNLTLFAAHADVTQAEPISARGTQPPLRPCRRVTPSPTGCQPLCRWQQPRAELPCTGSLAASRLQSLVRQMSSAFPFAKIRTWIFMARPVSTFNTNRH